MFKETRFFKILFAFKSVYIVYLLCTFNAFINTSGIMKYASYAVCFVGMCLIMWMLFEYKSYIHVRGAWILAFFIISFALSSLLNARYGIVENVKGICWLSISIFLFYLSSARYDKALMKCEFSVLAYIYVAVCTFFNIISLSMISWGKMYTFIDAEGIARAIGFRWGRLWGCYNDPNHGAVISLIALLLTLFLFRQAKKMVIKIILIASFLVQFLYMVFSDSRTGLVGLIFSFALLTLICVSIYGKEKNNKKKILRGIICAALMCVFVYTTDHAIKAVYNFAFAEAGASVGTPTDKMGRTESNLEPELTNGRTAIWKSGIDILKTTPVFGTSYRNMSQYAKDVVPDTYIAQEDTSFDSMHNSVMDVLVAQGIVGILIIGLFAVSILTYIWKQRKLLPDIEDKMMLLSGIIVLSVSIMSLFISIVLYVNTPANICLWGCLGIVVRLLDIYSGKNVQSSTMEGNNYETSSDRICD